MNQFDEEWERLCQGRWDEVTPDQRVVGIETCHIEAGGLTREAILKGRGSEDGAGLRPRSILSIAVLVGHGQTLDGFPRTGISVRVDDTLLGGAGTWQIQGIKEVADDLQVILSDR